MDLSPAPFYQLADTAEVPADAFWLRCDDNIRLRLALWRAENPQGTVLLFPGRTEYAEKYAPIAAILVAAGLHVLTVDWRGQGLSDRLQDNTRAGHIEDFAQYQLDVLAMVEAAGALDLPEPWHLLAHSMGGGIGLAALLNGLPVETASFSAPMWGINHAPLPHAVAFGLSRISSRLGLGGRPALGTGGGGAYVLDEPFQNNLLTGYAGAWARLVREASEWPELTLGGATYDWVAAALRECRRLATEASPDLPMLVSVGTREMIVSVNAIRERASSWPASTLLEIEGGSHEVLFESPERQAEFLGAFLNHIGIDAIAPASRAFGG
ncbi:alpha/beta fold hydrolase [Paracoccus aerodenitrificans]|uniref:alpha/beta fold hydrolase n=1 Tax=Paracoccus aerodenitrificans TaxID=3017781 RepID=UPI0022F0216A|nr:alpha/beta hydrolase [Paracoccus aerodenitrificans]WBU64491.1 alpha/beta hydrolase [Paracoccus aerodenitrificans]